MEWPLSLNPTYEAIKHETSGKPVLRKKPAEFLGTGQECKDGILPSVKCNIFERVWRCFCVLFNIHM